MAEASDLQFMFLVNGTVDDEGVVTLGIEAEPYFHNDEDVWNQDTEEWERMKDQPDSVWDRYASASRAIEFAIEVYNAQPAFARQHHS